MRYCLLKLDGYLMNYLSKLEGSGAGIPLEWVGLVVVFEILKEEKRRQGGMACLGGKGQELKWWLAIGKVIIFAWQIERHHVNSHPFQPRTFPGVTPTILHTH